MSYASPLDPDILPLIDPAYVEYYNKVILGQPQPNYSSTDFNPSVRSKNTSIESGDSSTYQVKEIKIGNCSIVVVRPRGDEVDKNSPVILYYHGGGWVRGSAVEELPSNAQVSVQCQCVIVSVDYRLAPENLYPAAIEDAWDALMWVWSNGADELGIDPNRIAVIGVSAGSHLAAVVTHMAVVATPPIPIIFQLLIVPCLDLDPLASYPSRTKFANTPELSLTKFKWYLNHFKADPNDWRAAPIKAPVENWAKLPPAFITVSGLDILRDEGVEYARLMNERGSKAVIKIYEGVPHNFPELFGVLDQSVEHYRDILQYIRKFFHPEVEK